MAASFSMAKYDIIWFELSSKLASMAASFSTTKYDIEKFTEQNSFNLWCIKLRAMLVHQGLIEGLSGRDKLPATLLEEQKELMEKVYSDILLSLEMKYCERSDSFHNNNCEIRKDKSLREESAPRLCKMLLLRERDSFRNNSSALLDTCNSDQSTDVLDVVLQ